MGINNIIKKAKAYLLLDADTEWDMRIYWEIKFLKIKRTIDKVCLFVFENSGRDCFCPLSHISPMVARVTNHMYGICNDINYWIREGHSFHKKNNNNTRMMNYYKWLTRYHMNESLHRRVLKLFKLN